MKNRLNALEGDHLFDDLHYGAEAKGEEAEISENSDQQEWQSENEASESEDIIDDGDSNQNNQKKSKNDKDPEVDQFLTDEFWNHNKKSK